jgi:tRNA-Thr(GGU) m(6)t(6)A37 methyltransferase TsaA
MPEPENYFIHPVGVVRSDLHSLEDAPMQGFEGAPEAVLEIYSDISEALDGIDTGDELILLTWFHQSQRDILRVHPRGNPDNPLTGVFLTRSPNRPNPIGLHKVKVLEVNGRDKIKVYPLEAVDGTPIIDIKPVI